MDNIIYSFISTEYGVLLLSISFFGLVSVFSNSSLKIAPAIMVGIFLLLVSVAHWFQLENNIILAKSRYYLLIIFDVLTAIVLFYTSWLLYKDGLLESKS